MVGNRGLDFSSMNFRLDSGTVLTVCVFCQCSSKRYNLFICKMVYSVCYMVEYGWE